MEKEELVWEKKNIWKAIKMKTTFIVLRTVCDCFVGLDKVLKAGRKCFVKEGQHLVRTKRYLESGPEGTWC